MITAQYLNADRVVVETKELSFKDMMKAVFDNYAGTANPEDTTHWFTNYVYKKSVVLLTSVDDLVPEFNLDAFQDHPELKEELSLFYKDIDVDLYVDVKKELPSFIASKLKPLVSSVGDFYKLNHFQSITFGEDKNKETYSVDGFNCYPEDPNYDINISGSNLDSNMILISLTPEKDPKLTRHNFRSIHELTDYTLAFHNKSLLKDSYYVHDFIILLSYKNYPRGFNV